MGSEVDGTVPLSRDHTRTPACGNVVNVVNIEQYPQPGEGNETSMALGRMP
tara:strand:+ start:782 stop:934 length:153 start_codon:yes stop_codon:yes gene_type:complete